MDRLDSYKLVIISDFHLSEGWDENGYLSRIEDFFFDMNFKRFLEYLSKKAEQGEFCYRLIIDGDLVDFLQFITVPGEGVIDGETLTDRERKLGLGTGVKKTLWKLERLINGHKILFTALADFMAKDHELVIICGNHDIEWLIPEVQLDFKKRISELHKPLKPLDDKIKFLTWFYYDPVLSVFIEHGSQYDDLNSFDYLLCPYRKDDTIDLPAGSFFVRYLFNRVEEIYPFADNMKPQNKFMKWALCQPNTWIGWPPQIFKFIQFYFNILGKVGPVEEDWAKELEKRHKKEIEKLAAISGVGEAELLKLKKHWVPSALHHKSSCALTWSFFINAGLDKDYYRRRAKIIQSILEPRYVIFGHTHEADMWTLSIMPDGKKSEYINSGSWTKMFAENYEEALLKSENEFVYVHIGYDDKKKDVKMDLMRWNDSLGEGERVRLFKSPKV
jgi:UDP-2,3-diacylglucosamine pyrophosphatase LpxH